MIVGVLTTCHMQQYVVAPMDPEILKVFFVVCIVQQLCISPLGAQFTKMVANGSEKAFCVLTSHYRVDVCGIQRVHIQSTCKVRYYM